MTPFNEAYSARGRVFVVDRHGERGEVVSLTEADPATRAPGEALVLFPRGRCVRYTATRFNDDLTIV